MDKQDVVHIYNGILLNHKKNEIMPYAATWMDIEIVILSLSKKKPNIIWYHLYVEFKNNGTNKLTYKTEIELQM